MRGFSPGVFRNIGDHMSCPVSIVVLAGGGADSVLLLLLLPHQVGGHRGQSPVLQLPHRVRLQHLQRVVTTGTGTACPALALVPANNNINHYTGPLAVQGIVLNPTILSSRELHLK